MKFKMLLRVNPRGLIFLGNSLIISLLFSQQEGNIEHMFQVAEKAFNDGKYRKALPIYEKIIKSYGDSLYLKYKMGICAIYHPDYYKKSYDYLKEVYAKKRDVPDLEYYLGLAAHLTHRFSEAFEYIDSYIQKGNGKFIKEAQLAKSWITNALEYTQSPKPVEIKNIGAPINSDGIEYAPILSADEQTIIFTYRGPKSIGGYIDYEYRDDIYISEKLESGLWGIPNPIPALNTPNHESALALTPDGQTLFIYRYTEEDGGDIYISKLRGKEWEIPQKLKGDVNTPLWEGSLTVSADGKVIIFASRRPGGYGGKDLWMAYLMPDESWGNVTNMGPEINSEFDEDGPFLLADQKTLIFSSNNEKSMGFMDIFQTQKDSLGNWSLPQNLGYPINTVADDIFYFVTPFGKGYYSSALKEGYGSYDIYEVYPGIVGKTFPIALVSGVFTVEGKPGGGSIEVNELQSGKLIGNYIANSATGKYFVILMPGKKYKITYSAEGYPNQYKEFDFTKLDSVAHIVYNVGFSKALQESFAKSYEDAIKKADEFYNQKNYVDALFYYSLALGLKPGDPYATSRIEEIKQIIPQLMLEGYQITTKEHKIGITPAAASQISKTKGTTTSTGDVFTIQIGAFKTIKTAQYYANIFSKKGYDVYIQNVHFTDVNEKFYRVRIGVFATIEEAIAYARTKLLSEKLPDKLVWIDLKQKNNLVIKKSDYPERPTVNKE